MMYLKFHSRHSISCRKEHFFFIILLLLSYPALGQNDSKRGTIKVKKAESDSIVYYCPDKFGQFPGGSEAILKFVNSSLVYPDSAKNNGISGTCYISFVVDTNGNIRNVKVIRGISGCPECDQEASRVVQLMPKWQAATNNGTPVQVTFILPIKFILK